jgi:hypothetical protein
MKLAIVGSRTFNDYQLLESTILQNFDIASITYVVSGGANGADKLGELFAKKHNIETIIYKPDWKKYGKSAGFLRNYDIINAADHVIAFWDGVSNGTKHDIDIATQKGKPLMVKKF